MHGAVLGKSKSKRAGLLEFIAIDDDVRGAGQGRETRGDDNIRAGAILGESLRVENEGDRPPGGEIADATELIAICFVQGIAGRASVGIGAQPLLYRNAFRPRPITASQTAPIAATNESAVKPGS